jgi:hypothetical protein
MNVVRAAEYKHILEALRDPQRRSWIMLNPTSIGDTAAVCAFARAFVKQHGHAITMVVPPDHLPVTQMFPNRFLRVLTVERHIMLHLMHNYLEPNRFELDVPFCAHPYDLGDCRGDRLLYLWKTPGRGGLSQTDLLRYLLRLPWDARLERPQLLPQWIAEAKELARQVGLEHGNSVTLFPANSSPIAQFPDVVWSTLVARLNERGYKVFCNMKGGNFRPKTMPIAGSIPIEIPMHLSLPLVSLAGRTISGPNGMQFLQMLGGRFDQMTVLAPGTVNLDDYEMNSRTYSYPATLAQFMYPEMCIDMPFSEYKVPYDGSEAELQRIATAIADQSPDDPSRFRRLGSGGGLFTDEHADWLAPLIEPITIDLNLPSRNV